MSSTMGAGHRLATTQKPGNALYTLSYDADSRRTTMMLGNGSKRLYDYDMRSQLTTQEELNASNVPIVTQIDSYDAVGNRMTRSVNGTVATWSYDDLYRLTGQVKPGQVATYTLDGVGNLKTMWEGGSFPKTFTFNATDRLVTMVEGASLTTYAWSGYGALESEITGNATTGYSYNGQDQLALVTEPSGDKTTYSFDGDGLRRSVATTNQNQDPPTLDVTTFVWDGSDYLLLNEPTSDKIVLTLESEIVHCGGKDLLTDPLGTLVKEISAGASLGGLVQLTPYGTLLPTSEEPSIPFIYVAAYGYYTDGPDRDYVRARELMKKTGRWMLADTAWPWERAYGYGRSSPVSQIDPSGLWAVKLQDCSEGQRNHITSILNQYLSSDRLAGFFECVEAADCRLNHPTRYGVSAGDCIQGFLNGNSVTIDCSVGPIIKNGCTSNTCAFTNFLARPPFIQLCPLFWVPGKCASHCVLLHELIHACGSSHIGGQDNFECVNRVPGCKSVGAMYIDPK